MRDHAEEHTAHDEKNMLYSSSDEGEPQPRNVNRAAAHGEGEDDDDDEDAEVMASLPAWPAEMEFGAPQPCIWQYLFYMYHVHKLASLILKESFEHA